MRKKKRPKTATTRRQGRSFVRPALVLACLSLLLTISVPSHSSKLPKLKQYARIFGTVWGPDDRPVPGVTVKIRRVRDKRARWEVHSNRRGEFEQLLPPGKQDYVIWADLKGYKPVGYKHLEAGPEVTVHIESNERADTGLHLK